MIARAFHDIWSLVIFLKFSELHSPAARAILRKLKTTLVPVYHEMHPLSYDFLYLFIHDKVSEQCRWARARKIK